MPAVPFRRLAGPPPANSTQDGNQTGRWEDPTGDERRERRRGDRRGRVPRRVGHRERANVIRIAWFAGRPVPGAHHLAPGPSDGTPPPVGGCKRQYESARVRSTISTRKHPPAPAHLSSH
ncbi:hypothetical protein EVG20_g8712 [Dentipellis fragilis]|uniref:Uncharacterized protein n=1 Tax=Dentipellis fragilis TaxID=205917 RepID=A0A4Y9Y5V9_9AGAM|nr:hypothetical protein EVG20_g8712 [Dentipellis fragilis]